MKSVYEFAGIFLYRDAVDMRKSINGLSVLVQEAGIGCLVSNVDRRTEQSLSGHRPL